MSIGQRIKELRSELSITQSELAERLNTTKQTIHKYENGLITNIPSDKLELIAHIFNVTPAYIMGWDELPNSTNDKTSSTLSQPENQLLNNFRFLNPEGQEKVLEYADDLVHLGRYKKCDFDGVDQKEA